MSQVKLEDVDVKRKKRSRKDDPLRANLGTRRVPKLRMANFPDADDIVRQGLLEEERGPKAVDIVFHFKALLATGTVVKSSHSTHSKKMGLMLWIVSQWW